MAEFLATSGHDVKQASNVPQALALVSTFGPEAMLIDIVLPVFDGNYLAAVLRRRGRLRPRLIAVTGCAERAQRELFDAVVPKPVAGPEVAQLLEMASALAAETDPGTPPDDDDDDA